LANLVNEATLLATRRKAAAVEMQDFNAAIERIIAGLEKRNRLLNPKEREVDRKSTRLNSSHVKISYAVFCLKKKKAASDARLPNPRKDVRNAVDDRARAQPALRRVVGARRLRRARGRARAPARGDVGASSRR